VPGQTDQADAYCRCTRERELSRLRRSGVQSSACAATSHSTHAAATARTTARAAPAASERTLRWGTRCTLPIRCEPRDLRATAYQTSQRAPEARTIGSVALHENACWNEGRFERGPITRYLAMG